MAHELPSFLVLISERRTSATLPSTPAQDLLPEMENKKMCETIEDSALGIVLDDVVLTLSFRSLLIAGNIPCMEQRRERKKKKRREREREKEREREREREGREGHAFSGAQSESDDSNTLFFISHAHLSHRIYTAEDGGHKLNPPGIYSPFNWTHTLHIGAGGWGRGGIGEGNIICFVSLERTLIFLSTLLTPALN